MQVTEEQSFSPINIRIESHEEKTLLLCALEKQKENLDYINTIDAEDLRIFLGELIFKLKNGDQL